MSSRLSTATKDLIYKSYREKVSVLRKERSKIEDEILDNIKKDFVNTKEFKELAKSIKDFNKLVEKKYPNIRMYSSYKYNLSEDTTFYYFDDKEKEFLKDKRWIELGEKIKELEKEERTLIIKLENSPLKSKDYEEAYELLKKIIE